MENSINTTLGDEQTKECRNPWAPFGIYQLELTVAMVKGDRLPQRANNWAVSHQGMAGELLCHIQV